MEEVLEIKTTSKNFYYEYLLLKQPLLETILSKVNGKKITLSPKILKVFSILLYYNSLSENNSDLINEIVKRDIMDQVNIKESHLNTYLSVLRNIKILNKNSINKPFMVYPGKEFQLTYRFILNGHE